MLRGARDVRFSLTGREKNVLNGRRGIWHSPIGTCALEISLGFLAVPSYHNCCMELIVSSKGGISKFLSKGLFFYYLLNFQTFSNFGGKKRKHMRNVSAIIPSCFVCDEVVLWLKEFYLLFNWYYPTAPLHKNGKMKKSFSLTCLHTFSLEHHFTETRLYL